MSIPSLPRTTELYDLSHTLAAELLCHEQYPWQVIGMIKSFIIDISAKLDPELYENRGDRVYIARDAVVAPSAYIAGPCIIDSGAEIRHCAYIRGSAIVGRGAVVGNSCELKNCILFDGVADRLSERGVLLRNLGELHGKKGFWGNVSRAFGSDLKGAGCTPEPELARGGGWDGIRRFRTGAADAAGG